MNLQVARYSLLGAVFAAFGALASGIPDWLAATTGIGRQGALGAMFVIYGLVGAAVWLLCRSLPVPSIAIPHPVCSQPEPTCAVPRAGRVATP